jgi:transposase
VKYIKGKALEPREKHAIVVVKKYFDRIRSDYKLPESSVQMTADALEFGLSTVRRVMADFKRDPGLLDKVPAPKGRPNHVIDCANESFVRSFIRTANQHGEYITLSKITEYLNTTGDSTKFHSTTLSRTLNRWGFEFGKGTRSQHLKEKDEVIIARQKYLRLMRSNRGENNNPIQNEVYLDESYVNKNHSNDFIWYSGEDGPLVQKPTGKGERLIILNAITSSGWVPNAKLVFQAKRKTGDYHGQMNAEMFSKWFTEKLIPNIPENSLIIMDNASYHNILSADSPPIKTSSKENISKWLTQNKISYQPDLLKVELASIINCLNLEPIYILDEIAKAHGHKIIRTPPYHPELQPIELCWGVVKNHIARNCDFTLATLKQQLEIGFTKVKPSTCKKLIKKIKGIEDKFWNEDMKFDPSE